MNATVSSLPCPPAHPVTTVTGPWSAACACATRADWALDVSAPRANIIPPNKTDAAPTQQRQFVVDAETVCAASVPVARLILGRFGGRTVNVMTSAASVPKDKYAQVMVSATVATVSVALDGPAIAVPVRPAQTPAWGAEECCAVGVATVCVASVSAHSQEPMD